MFNTPCTEEETESLGDQVTKGQVHVSGAPRPSRPVSVAAPSLPLKF